MNLINLILIRLATSFILGVASLSSVVDAAPLIQKDLYFSSNPNLQKSGGWGICRQHFENWYNISSGQVFDAQFKAFVNSILTPYFPDGLTITDGKGQFKDSSGIIVEEPLKIVTLFVEDTPVSQSSIKQIISAYLTQFNQESILQVTNEDELKIGFGAGEYIIENDLIPELIQVELFFGRNIPGGGQVSEEQFQTFVDNIITSRFPNGLTIFDSEGQFKDSTGTIIKEPSKVVSLVFENTIENENYIDEIVSSYIQQFNQESVLVAANEEVAVGFGVGENLIDNDPIPELIQVELSFRRDIPGGGEVSEAQFQAFVDSIITPRFPDKLTSFDTQSQFQDNSGVIIKKASKVVTLLLEDTVTNENAIDEIITAYLQQFNQESVLLVVDEDLKITCHRFPNLE